VALDGDAAMHLKQLQTKRDPTTKIKALQAAPSPSSQPLMLTRSYEDTLASLRPSYVAFVHESATAIARPSSHPEQ
jgi:hypothetical protein